MHRFIVIHLKKRISKIPKQSNKKKTQLNIKKYLHKIPSKDQDPKIMNKLRVDEDKHSAVKRCANKSSVATCKLTGEMFETQINSRNHGRTFYYYQLIFKIFKPLHFIIKLLFFAVIITIGQLNEYFKFEKEDLNKYFCYDE